MEKQKYLLVEAGVLPDVFLRVLHAKELLASGEARNVSKATATAGVSRSAFYKYKDSVFYADTGQEVVTLTATLLDETGTLRELLSAISGAGAGVLTINQSMPENGVATVTISVRTDGMRMTVDELCRRLEKQPAVVEMRRSK